MKACTIHGPKSLEIEDRPIPKPDTNELIIRLGAGGIVEGAVVAVGALVGGASLNAESFAQIVNYIRP